MKRYKTTRWYIEIEEIEVIRETDNFIIFADENRYNRKKEQRAAKRSEFHLYHETWEAAHAYLLERAKNRIDQSQSELNKFIGELKIIESMKKGN